MENDEAPVAPVKKTVKKRKAKKRAALAAVPKSDTGPYAGLTVAACCKACGIDGCVISGKPYCAHPRKGGLHPEEMHDPDAMRRAQGAQRLLGEQLLDARTT